MSPNAALALGAALPTVAAVGAGVAAQGPAEPAAGGLALALTEVTATDGGYLAVLRVSNPGDAPLPLPVLLAAPGPILSDANGGLCATAFVEAPTPGRVAPRSSVEVAVRYAARDCVEPLAPGAAARLIGKLASTAGPPRAFDLSGGPVR